MCIIETNGHLKIVLERLSYYFFKILLRKKKTLECHKSCNAQTLIHFIKGPLLFDKFH